ncbi:hypothetical protein V2J09_005554, partial [Rumex salicifolius]
RTLTPIEDVPFLGASLLSLCSPSLLVHQGKNYNAFGEKERRVPPAFASLAASDSENLLRNCVQSLEVLFHRFREWFDPCIHKSYCCKDSINFSSLFLGFLLGILQVRVFFYYFWGGFRVFFLIIYIYAYIRNGVWSNF